ncbi:hypothetical protein PINS_up016382, partial [Pythium insidiosum]
MREKVRQELYREQASPSSMTTATLTKNVLRAVSAPRADERADDEGVGGGGGQGQRRPGGAGSAYRRLGRLGGHDERQAASSRSSRMRRVASFVLLGTKDVLRQPTGVINKNVASTDNQAIIRNTNISPTSNDV